MAVACKLHLVTDREAIRLQPGGEGVKRMPASEVCLHMRAFGRTMAFRLTDTDYPMVQLYEEGGRPFSFPILPGEAGIYRDGEGFYYYAA